ncbi:MAG TPA: HD domain-containing phosphohydrolase [Terriglobia bacterium]|nr:HD domain-containing phosphohydrolase [Terriglobia bacterium]
MIDRILPKVLVVDDEPAVRMFFREALRSVASQVAEAGDAPRALAAIESGDFDVVVCDVWMPGASGLDLLSLAQQNRWDVGFVLVTGQIRAETVIAALRLRAADFLLKPLRAEEVTHAVKRAFEQLMAARQMRAYQGSLESTIQRRTLELEKALSELESNYQMTLEALVAALDAREHETFSHSLRVRAYTRHLARQGGYPPALLPPLEQGALLHDIGKIAVADAILLKPAKLNEEEWVEMRKHPAAGDDILRRVPFLRPASAIVRHHHERFDGTGYPDSLKAAEIPLGARLFTVADTLDAMTTDRAYRKAPGFEAARAEIQRCGGKQFDPHIVDMFLKIPLPTWMQVRDEAANNSISAK